MRAEGWITPNRGQIVFFPTNVALVNVRTKVHIWRTFCPTLPIDHQKSPQGVFVGVFPVWCGIGVRQGHRCAARSLGGRWRTAGRLTATP
jgi:hypothetical protein